MSIIAQSKKQQLIASIKDLQLPTTEEKNILDDIEHSFKNPPTDLNHMLSRLIFFKIVANHPSVLTNANNHAFKRFCLEEVGLMDENKQQPKHSKGR